jgi:hypothetical protein
MLTVQLEREVLEMDKKKYIKQRLASILRETKLEQGFGRCYNDVDKTFCAYGALLVAFGDEERMYLGRDTPQTAQVNELLKEIGLRSGDIVDMNDSNKMTFSQIADEIERR